MNMVLFGAPGSGKGTQSKLLVEKMGYEHISTGDLFRAAIKNSTELGILAKSYMDKGNLVPDDVTVGLVREKLSALKGKKFILDGFPRNVSQAESLKKILGDLKMSLDCAVFVDVPESLLLERLTGRRTCMECGAAYHIVMNKPKQADICDKCGSKLVHRKDDFEDVIKTRLNEYNTGTAPLKEYYRDGGSLKVIDGSGTVDEIFNRIVKAI